VKKVEGILREQNRYAATFYNIGEHSPISGIHAGVEAFKQSGADIIVSVGGGSPIDASKAIIYFLHEQLGGDFLRQIAIPTTLSAAEYTVRCVCYSCHLAEALTIFRERLAQDIPTKRVKRQV